MEEEQSKVSILMFPWLAHGHIYPFFELAKRLSTRNFKIYICSTAIILDSINAKEASSSSSSIELVELHVPSSPELPPHMHTTKNLPPHLIPNLIRAFQDSRTSFLQILNAKKPDLVIYDFFQPWAAKFASSQGIPAVFFGVIGSTPYSYYHHQLITMKDGSHDAAFPSKTVHLLGHEKYNDTGILNELLKEDDDDVEDDFFYGNFTRSSEIVLMKSCRVVEGKYADHLSSLCKKQVVTTGPLVSDQHKHSADDDDDILKWLSGKERSSTLYISFGSEHFLSEQEIQQIAKGLELCEDVNFIWVIRFAPDQEGGGGSLNSLSKVLPQTFLDEAKERGMVITGWAPQPKILAHPSVGGFLSHCGSNAVTEAMMIYGVPVIAMPIKYEQPLAARLLVEAGFAAEVVGKPAESDWIYTHYMGEEIANAIKKVFVEKECGEALRKRAKELSQKIKETEEDEVSHLAEQLLKLCIKYKQNRE